jgi:hypothetical protein
MALRSFEQWLFFSRLFVVVSVFWGCIYGFAPLPAWSLAVLLIWFAAYRAFQIRRALRGVQGLVIAFGVLSASSLVLGFTPDLLIRTFRHLISN